MQRIEFGGTRTWTVVGEDHLPVGPIEEFLDHLRVAQQSSPNTVRSYATSLDRWWRYLTDAELAWDEVRLPAFTPYLTVLRAGERAGVRMLPGVEPLGGLAETTVAVRVAAVLSFYRYHADVHAVPVADRLYRAGRRPAAICQDWSTFAAGSSPGPRCGCAARPAGRCHCSPLIRSMPSWTAARGGMLRPEAGQGRCATGCCSPRSRRPA